MLLNEDSDVDNIIEEEEETIIFTKSKTSGVGKTIHDFSQTSSIKSRIIRKGKKPKKHYQGQTRAQTYNKIKKFVKDEVLI